MGRRLRSLQDAVLPFSAADAQRQGEPDWLLQKRQAAWQLAESLPLPDLSDEAWRRTDLRDVDWAALAGLDAAPQASLAGVPAELYRPLIGEEQGGLLVFAEGQLVHAELAASLKAQGVIFTDLGSAARDHAELVQRFFMTQVVQAHEGKFAALHAALWTHGVFLYVPKGVQVELPLHSVEYVAGRGLTSTHILAVLEDGAAATYLHESASAQGTGPLLHLGATELLAGPGANLRYVALQNWGDDVINLGHQRGRVARGAQLDWVAGEMGAAFEKVFMTLDLDGDDAWGRISGLYFGHGTQHLDLDTQQNHHALRTTSDLLFKGAMKDTSRSVWQGIIVVDQGAQQTDGFQANRNLLLERTARADSIPGLEIKADDVRCTHAATVGKVDPVEMFYLMARGVPRLEALKLIVQGFFDPVMQRIPFEEIRERLIADIDAKLDAMG